MGEGCSVAEILPYCLMLLPPLPPRRRRPCIPAEEPHTLLPCPSPAPQMANLVTTAVGAGM